MFHWISREFFNFNFVEKLKVKTGIFLVSTHNDYQKQEMYFTGYSPLLDFLKKCRKIILNQLNLKPSSNSSMEVKHKMAL